MSLSAPHLVQAKLEAIEADLAERQNELELAALAWYRLKRDQEEAKATAFIHATGTVAERQAIAATATAHIGKEEEAMFEALKAVCRVLETRASIGMSLLRSQGRA